MPEIVLEIRTNLEISFRTYESQNIDLIEIYDDVNPIYEI